MIVCKDLFAGAVVVVSIVILLALFSIQQFGTRKVGFLFASILALWFFCLGSIGLYNLLKHDITVLRAVNPAYIISSSKRTVELHGQHSEAVSSVLQVHFSY
ncbi:uncharacterized protein J3R85_005971 [Psidium guajava]|nr:uncharacterized protein J3R85_005971 [Psidium guajava]